MHGETDGIVFTGRSNAVLAVFMNAEHPLAVRENITLEELCAWPNIYAAAPERGKAVATEQNLFSASGIHPIRMIYVHNHNITNLLLDLNMGIAVAPELLLEAMPKNIVCRPLEHGRFTIEMGWAYDPGNRNPALRQFLNYIMKKTYHKTRYLHRKYRESSFYLFVLLLSQRDFSLNFRSTGGSDP